MSLFPSEIDRKYGAILMRTGQERHEEHEKIRAVIAKLAAGKISRKRAALDLRVAIGDDK